MHRLNIPEKLALHLKKAAETIVFSDSPVRIFSHQDADGISAAAILGKTLLRENREFHISIIGGIDEELIKRIKKEKDNHVIFLDIGSGDIGRLDSVDASIIILDHHIPGEDIVDAGRIMEINCHRYGIDGTTGASGATMAFLMALAINPKNSDLVHLSLSGSIGDRQHIGGFSGINRKVVELGEEEELIGSKKGLNLRNLPVKEAISLSTDPFFRGLSGREAEAEKLLKSLKIDVDMRLSELTQEEERRLSSALLLRLLKQGCRPEIVDELITLRYLSSRMGAYISEIAECMDATSKRDPGIGVSLGMGDEGALYRAKEIFEKYNEELMKALMTLEKRGAREMEHIQWFWTYSEEMGSAQAGIGMQYLLNQEKPVFALTETDRGYLKISARGTRYLLSKGLNLAEICRDVSEKLGGKGGGHNIASGCIIPYKKKKDFLLMADESVGRQIGAF